MSIAYTRAPGRGDTDLLLIDLGRGRNRMGGSALAQVYRELGAVAPDLDNAADLKNFFLRWYGPNNATLTIGGDVDTAAVVALVGVAAGSLLP